ncbi:hypothetical protein [Ferrimonas balearica]|uniref:hypothetical protein n=1 Tax=Ferrimonas balearica TaxID=44012 RepID=UPI001C568202|nr:hypothetical protein [Ferrimonas balearica]MBW3164613.1 hypothetical protein [Ferrimonas balearica]
MKKVIIIIVLSFSAYPAEVKWKDGEIYYVGDIDNDGIAKVKQLYEKSEVKPTTMVITSPGGYIVYGLDLAEWVLDNEIRIEVSDYCISSCANYVFAAGKEKRLRKSAILGWHGGSVSSRDGTMTQSQFIQVVTFYNHCDLNQLSQYHSRNLYFSQESERECRFFRRTGANPMLLFVGQWRRLGLYNNSAHFWSYTLDSLNQLGLTNIILVDDLWDPPASVPDFTIPYLTRSQVETAIRYGSVSLL